MRRGFRGDCDCAYCQLKVKAFSEIATAGGRFFRERPYNTLSQEEKGDIGYAIWLMRKKLRIKWRGVLRDFRDNYT